MRSCVLKCVEERRREKERIEVLLTYAAECGMERFLPRLFVNY